ncbi:unnamed protein product [Paramecium pentaurelia]|uniref:Uncharacterized protein n=1 Tax=Paramecium pentaurelia TaxID=43138 RepID=A0A8S1VIP4_9CILI|nr:unnamed protein product [Paramecium pentaurelia]
MKLFKAFCQGKSILVRDTQKLTKYIDLCLKTPVSYKGIQKSIGYDEIIRAQFNSKEFNKALFPQFINLIGRDFKEINQKEFNYFIQSLSCYVESATNQKVFDKLIFENFVNQVSLNATYIQKSLFFLTLYWYVAFYEAIQQSQQVVDKFQADLFEQVPETAEDRLWRVFIEMHQLQLKKKSQINDEKLKKEEQKIMEKFIDQIEEVDINLPKFTNIMSRFMLLKYYSFLKYFNVQNFDKRFHNLLFSVYTTSQNYITENLSSLNSFGLYGYIDLISQNKDIFIATKWDIILNEINSKNLNEIPIFDIIALSFVIIKNNKMTTQLGNRIIQHLYDNINSISSNMYADIFQIIAKVNCDLNDKFLTKLQSKVIPKDLSLEHISIILGVLQRFHRIDLNILEKYLVGIGTRIKDIDKKSGLGILSALNYNHQQNPVIFSQILQLKLEEDKDLQLQIEILKYLQLHDPQNDFCMKIQQNFVKSLKKEYDFKLICSILEVLLHFNDQSQKTITIIPELKQYVKKGLEQIKQSNELDKDVLEFLMKQYKIEI